MSNFFSNLVNLFHQDQDDGISPLFIPRQLSGDLKTIHSILFPPYISRTYSLFLANTYMRLIQASGLLPDTGDVKLSAQLESNSFFKSYNITNLESNNPETNLLVLGQYNNSDYLRYLDSTYETILIFQIANSYDIAIYSPIRGKYIAEDHESSILTPNEYISVVWSSYLETQDLLPFLTQDLQPLALQDESAISKPIPVGSTGVSFLILNLSGTFTGTYNKSWSFDINYPYTFDFKSIYSQVYNDPSVTSFISSRSSAYTNLWTMHQNPVYKFAGFLIEYVNSVKSL